MLSTSLCPSQEFSLSFLRYAFVNKIAEHGNEFEMLLKPSHQRKEWLYISSSA